MGKLKKGFLTRIKNSSFEGNNAVGHFSHVYSSTVGRMTYIGSNSSILYSKIGSFCSISSHVWIGANVLILNGVHIGDGAVIASGAVVTRDVAPYSIVGGVPAKEIRKRFSDEEISFLLRHPFWEQSDNWIEQHAKDFSSVEKYRGCFSE